MKFCVYTRNFLEEPYLNFFIEHYILLGFDKIIVLKTDNEPYEVPSEFKKYVEIYKVCNDGDMTLPVNDHLIKKDNYDWVLCVDIDEILLLDKRYKTIHEFVESKLQSYPDINVFFFRWGMIEKYDVEPYYTLKEIVNKYKLFSNTHIKSMAKISELNCVPHPHLCDVKKPFTIFMEDEIIGNNDGIGHKYTKKSYNESVLIHLHTRSLNNLILKSISSAFTEKLLTSMVGLRKLIETKNVKDVYTPFMEFINHKAKQPFIHKNNRLVDISNMNIYDYSYNLIEEDNEINLTKKILQHKNIKIDNYESFVKKLSEITVTKGFIK